MKKSAMFFLIVFFLFSNLSKIAQAGDELATNDILNIFNEKDEQKRISVIKILATISDDRIYDAFKWLLFYDPSIKLKIDISSILGDISDEKSTKLLGQTLIRKESPRNLKLSILDSLQKQKTDFAADILFLHKDSEDDLLRARTRNILADTYSEYTKKKGGLGIYKQKYSESIWMYPLGMSIFGLFDMLFLADISNAEDSARGWIGIAGLLLGGGAGFFLNNDGHMSTEEVLTTFSMGAWGIWAGNKFVHTYSIDDGNGDNWAMFAGSLSGLTLGSLYSDDLNFTTHDIFAVNISGFAGLFVGNGISKLTLGHTPNEQIESGIASGTAFLGLAGGAYLTKKGILTENDAERIIYSTALLTWTGLFFPATFNQDNDRYSQGGLLLGSGVGYFGGALSKKLYNPTTQQMRVGMLSYAYGSMLGAGIPSFKDDISSQFRVIPMLATGWGSAVLGSFYSDHLSIAKEDLYLMGFSPLWGTFQFFCLNEYVKNKFDLSGSQMMGVAFTTIPLFGVGGWLLAKNTDMDFFDSSLITLAGFWGSWLSGWGTVVLQHRNDEIDDDERWLWTGIGGDLGLALGGLLVSPLVNVSKQQLGIINLSGAGGMALGIAVQAIVDPNSTSLAEGNLIGSLVGLTAGAIGTTFLMNNNQSKSVTDKKESISLNTKILPIPTLSINKDPVTNEQLYQIDLLWFF